VPHLAPVVSWVLEWGPDARAIEPAGLVEQIKSELDAARAQYVDCECNAVKLQSESVASNTVTNGRSTRITLTSQATLKKKELHADSESSASDQLGLCGFDESDATAAIA
jgi:hypothetical protein